jgi:hypothetical protein
LSREGREGGEEEINSLASFATFASFARPAIAPRELRQSPAKCAIVPLVAQFFASPQIGFKRNLSFVSNNSVRFWPFGALRHLYCIKNVSS